MSFNKIIIVGNLGRDPELRYTPQGHAVCTFSMATNDKRTDKSGEKVDVVTWFKITLWRERAETAAKYLTKGSPVYIEGRLRIEEWTDRDNNNRYSLDVQASEMQFISSGNRDQSAGDYQHSQAAPAEFPTHTGGGPGSVTPDPASSAAPAQSSFFEQPKTSTSGPSIADDDIPF